MFFRDISFFFVRVRYFIFGLMKLVGEGGILNSLVMLGLLKLFILSLNRISLISDRILESKL